MQSVSTHSNPRVQQALSAVTAAGLTCVELAQRGDAPEGFLLILSGAKDLEACQVAFLQAANALREEFDTEAIIDHMHDPKDYELVYIFNVDGNIINLALMTVQS